VLVEEATPEVEPVVETGYVAYSTEEVYVEESVKQSGSEVTHPTPREEMQQVQHAHIEAAIHEATDAMTNNDSGEDLLIQPVYTEDYFRQQGVTVPDEIPQQIEDLKQAEAAKGGLMVMMSFTEWLLHFKHTSQKEKEENEEQSALKAMWQMEKLTAAMGEENEEIPENVFEMAVNSITREEDLASEPLANIYIKQGKYEKAIEMYRKLSLRNPQKMLTLHKRSKKF
jgi:tetratricopeptide (TPR) repeat protein